MVKSEHNKGNALVIALILITIILTIALGVGYMTVAEVKMQTSLEEASIAYSAAEAGIEDGLLRWRYNHDVETVDINPVYKEQIDRVDLGVGTVEKQSVPPDPVIPQVSDASWYDLKVTYRKLTSATDAISGTIEKDKVLEISGLDDKHYAIPNAVTLHINFTMNGPVAEIKVAHIGGIVESSIGSNATPNFLYTLQTNDVVKVRAWSGDVDYTMYATQIGVPDVALDTGETTIESVGYYGDSKRKLVAKIDRKNSVLLGIFDMTLYSGTGSIGVN